PGSLVMKERGVAMAFQAEHALFMPLQEKLVGRAVRRVTARAPLNATGQMFEGEWTTFLDMALRAGLIMDTAQGKTTLAAMRWRGIGPTQATFQALGAHRRGKGRADFRVTGKAQVGRLRARETRRHVREMRRMTVVTGNPGQLVLTAPEVKLLDALL